MKKIITSIIVASTISTSLFAGAYLGVDVAMESLDSGSAIFEYNDGYAVDVTAGYEFGAGFGLEGLVTYSAVSPSASGTYMGTDFDISATLLTYAASLVYTLDLKYFKPFVKVGYLFGGTATVSTTFGGVSSSSDSSLDGDIAYSAGIAFPIGAIDLMTEYKALSQNNGFKHIAS